MSNDQIRRVIGQRVRYYRIKKALTQKALAVELGVASSYLANIEQGHKGISLEKIVELCIWFDINVSDLLPLETRGIQDDKELIIRNIAESLKTWDIEKVKLLESMVVRF